MATQLALTLPVLTPELGSPGLAPAPGGAFLGPGDSLLPGAELTGGSRGHMSVVLPFLGAGPETREGVWFPSRWL